MRVKTFYILEGIIEKYNMTSSHSSVSQTMQVAPHSSVKDVLQVHTTNVVQHCRTS